MEIENTAFKLYEKSLILCKKKNFKKALSQIKKALSINTKFKEDINANKLLF